MLKTSIFSLFGRSRGQATHPSAASGSAASAFDSRRHARIEVSIPVVVHKDGVGSPLVMRNISPGGAMVQGSHPAHPDDLIHVVHGGLCAQAKVIWRAQDRTGLEFLAEIDLVEWLAPTQEIGQERVDGIVALVKAGVPAGSIVDGGAGDSKGQTPSSTLSDDLGIVSALLCALRDELHRSDATRDSHGTKLPLLDEAIDVLADPALLRRSRRELVDGLGAVLQLLVEVEDDVTGIRETVAKHGYRLQNLDLAMQMLTEVGSELIIGSEEGLASSPRLINLRSVCKKALQPDAPVEDVPTEE